MFGTMTNAKIVLVFLLSGLEWQTAEGAVAQTRSREASPNSKGEQAVILKQKAIACHKSMENQTTSLKGLHCNMTWDGVLCWPATSAGTIVVKPCPDYVYRFLPEENATRRCNADGTWFVNESTNKSWSNYSKCTTNTDDSDVPGIRNNHIEKLYVIRNIGNGLSLASLVVAVLIMLFFKKLHCPRNKIHLNLFLSFILSALFYFIKNGSFIGGTGFRKDIATNEEGKTTFIEEGSHWECRLFITLMMYSRAANYTWIFVEAVYLQASITVAVFAERRCIYLYMLLGWALPLSFMIPWVVVRVTLANKYCWTTYDDCIHWVQWIIHGPIFITVCINFLIFINIVRVLYTKVNALNFPDKRKFRYRRLAKSILILIPLFGVYYMVFGIMFVNIKDNKSYIMYTYIYLELFFNSFQGFFLSLLLCFFNSEVQNEFKKAWRQYTSSRLVSSRWRATITSRTGPGKVKETLNQIGLPVVSTVRQ